MKTMAYGNLAKVRRQIETERLRRSMPWANERELRATVEHVLHHLDLSGHFAGMAPIYSSLASDTLRGRSGAIWGQFPTLSILENPTKGILFHEDFMSFGGLVTTKVGNYTADTGSWKSYEETGSTIVQSNTLGVPTAAIPASGVITMTSDGTANDTVALAAGFDTGGAFMITGNNAPTLYYEARVSVGPAAFTAMDTFVGLIEKGVAAAQFLFTTGDAVNQKSAIGFYSLTASPLAIVPFYGKNGVAPVPVTNGSNGLWTPGAPGTWTKLGFIYNNLAQNSRLLQYFQDGVLKGWVTDCSVTAFPTAKAMTPAFVIQAAAAGLVLGTMSIDWVDVGQTYQ